MKNLIHKTCTLINILLGLTIVLFLYHKKMKKIFSTLIIFLLFTSSIFAADEIEKGKTLLKSLSKKSLTKKETISFLKEYAVIVEDERGDGKVTYIFDDEKYSRYKGTEIISTDSWRFSKLGALRLFNKDIKMTWKIKISDKENLINIKTKFDPVGKLYEFEVKTKKEFLDQIEQIKQAKIEKKNKLEQEKLAAEKKRKEEERKLEEERLAAEQKLEKEKRKLEEERLAAEQKLEEEKRKLEEEKLALQKELEELKKKKAEELEQSEKTPAQIKKEERERKKQEKLAAKTKAKEEKEKLKQEKLEAKKKAEEEKEKLKQEKLAKSKVKNEKNANIEKHKLCMKMIEAAFYQDWDNKIFKNKLIKDAIESADFNESLKMVRMMLIMGSTNPTKRKGKYHWDDFAGIGMLQFCPPDQYNLELTDVDF